MKTMEFSRTVTTEIMCPEHANARGDVHGGVMLKLMDNTSGVAAMRHAGHDVVTASADDIQFVRPIKIGDIVQCTAMVVYAGTTSMVVRAMVEICDKADWNHRQLAMLGFFIMVARDSDGTLNKVPPIQYETDEGKALYEQGERRYQRSKEKRLRI